MARRQPVNRRLALNRDRLLSVAVRLADRGGIDSLTMRKLGKAVGVEAMSLYNHVADKDDLLAGMVDLIFREIDLHPGGDGDWKSAMRQQAVSAREVLDRHPWAIGLMDSRTSPGSATLGHFEAVLRSLRAAGFSVELSSRAYGVIYSYVYGFVVAFEDGRHTAQQIIERAPAELYPYATEVIVEHLLKPEFDRIREFEGGLDLILDGLERASNNRGGPVE